MKIQKQIERGVDDLQKMAVVELMSILIANKVVEENGGEQVYNFIKDNEACCVVHGVEAVVEKYLLANPVDKTEN